MAAIRELLAAEEQARLESRRTLCSGLTTGKLLLHSTQGLVGGQMSSPAERRQSADATTSTVSCPHGDMVTEE
jgi:hypothetical protein